MSQPANPSDLSPPPETESDEPSQAVQERPSDDGSPHAGPSLDLPMSSPE